ncbi:MAG: hypothetical protein ACLUL2_24350 [Blautia sp.]
MDKEMTRGRALLFLISLFLTNVAVMADMVIIPAGNGLYETFQNDAAVNLSCRDHPLSCFSQPCCAENSCSI